MKNKLILDTSADNKGHYRYTNIRHGTYVRSEILFFCVEMSHWRENDVYSTDVDGTSAFNENEWRKLLHEGSITFSRDVISRRWRNFVDEKLWR